MCLTPKENKYGIANENAYSDAWDNLNFMTFLILYCGRPGQEKMILFRKLPIILNETNIVIIIIN